MVATRDAKLPNTGATAIAASTYGALRRSIRRGEHIAVYRIPGTGAAGTRLRDRDWDHQFI